MLGKEAKKNDLIFLSNELAYKLLLALFPFVIFLMTILGFLNIDGYLLFQNMDQMLPQEILDIFNAFVKEVIETRNVSLLSGSLLVAIYSASSGFNAIIRGINKTYGQTDTRSFLRRRLISLALMLLFTLSIAVMLVMIIFGKHILRMINSFYALTPQADYIFGVAGFFFSMLVLQFAVMITYHVGSCKKSSLIQVFPGAFFTVLFWVLSCKAFNIYINNFSRYSMIYGSIAGVFILILWLSLISALLLLGSQVNALLEMKS